MNEFAHRRSLFLLLTLFSVPSVICRAQVQTTGPGPGHSFHGEAFNEGPRQGSFLMPGMSSVHLPVSTKSKLAQKYFDQGVSQLHGFWYFEAERTFRQVNKLDPNCAMAFWGMAMANTNNESRAKAFIAEAVKKLSTVTDRERLYIEALAAFYDLDGKTPDAKKRHANRISKFIELCRKYPDDIEAKAFTAVEIWENQGLARMWNTGGMEYLLNEILKKNPMHPVHHYRIHLWDGGHADKALNSSARCGQCSSGIAHMWHMPGHIYSDLHRYIDASWQQEAGVRVDNAQLMLNRVLPDQIHNYAHNSEWLMRDLSNVGRVHDAITLGKNMIEMPRHPKYNTIAKGSSTSAYGRLRLFEALARYEMWDDTIALCNSTYLEPTTSSTEQAKRACALAEAHFSKGALEKGNQYLTELASLEKAPSKPTNFDNLLLEAEGYREMSAGRYEAATAKFEKVSYFPKERLAGLYLKMGKTEKALELAKTSVSGRPNEVQPLATLIEALASNGKITEARTEFEKLQKISEPIDLDAPIFQRISRIAEKHWGIANWKRPYSPPTPVGERPSLDSLGPLCWGPSPAFPFTLKDSDGNKVSLSDYQKAGKPVLVIFYLGAGCRQCMEQLNLFSPLASEFEKAGISLLAISTDSVKGLKSTITSDPKAPKFNYPLLSDEKLQVFKAYRAYDDFEGMPLHGCYLIDKNGYVRWQDISFQPFKETSFLLEECKRLLQISPTPSTLNASIAELK